MGNELLKQLDQKIISVVDKGGMSRRCAGELTYVQPPRQVEILTEMQKSGDYSISFVRAMVIKTPVNMRNKDKKNKKPWKDNSDNKEALVEKLEYVQKRYDFYTNLYRQYTEDFLKLYIYVRKLITNDKVRTYLDINYSEILERFENIIFENEKKQVESQI